MEVVLENAAVDRLATTPEALAAMPFLRQLSAAPAPGGCPCNPQPSNLDVIRNTIKAQMAGLAGDTLAVLKRLLGATSLVIYYQDGAGRVQTARL